MGKATYHNRYQSIMKVVHAIGEYGDETPTQISKRVNMSRQNVLDVLKHAEKWGYTYHKEYVYRAATEKCQEVKASLWYVTGYGFTSAKWFIEAMSKYQSGKGMKPLL